MCTQKCCTCTHARTHMQQHTSVGTRKHTQAYSRDIKTRTRGPCIQVLRLGDIPNVRIEYASLEHLEFTRGIHFKSSLFPYLDLASCPELRTITVQSLHFYDRAEHKSWNNLEEEDENVVSADEKDCVC